MPEFLEVILARALGDFPPECCVAPLAAIAAGVVAALDVLRQGEEGMGEPPAFLDKASVHAMVAHHGEAELAERVAERLCEVSRRHGCHRQQRYLLQRVVRQVSAFPSDKDPRDP